MSITTTSTGTTTLIISWPLVVPTEAKTTMNNALLAYPPAILIEGHDMAFVFYTCDGRDVSVPGRINLVLEIVWTAAVL